MIMRVAVGIHGPNVKLGTPGDLDRVLETYTYMSEKWFTHASPTMFNAGTKMPQMSSCFLLTMQACRTHAACSPPARRLQSPAVACSRLQPLPPHDHRLRRLRAACAAREPCSPRRMTRSRASTAR